MLKHGLNIQRVIKRVVNNNPNLAIPNGPSSNPYPNCNQAGPPSSNPNPRETQAIGILIVLTLTLMRGPITTTTPKSILQAHNSCRNTS